MKGANDVFSGNVSFKFLNELADHNRREWFEENKVRYEALVREPTLALIDAMAPELKKFAPHFRADVRKMGGSLMRVFRDTRFSRGKTPYKTNIGIQFRHELGKRMRWRLMFGLLRGPYGRLSGNTKEKRFFFAVDSMFRAPPFRPVGLGQEEHTSYRACPSASHCGR